MGDFVKAAALLVSKVQAAQRTGTELVDVYYEVAACVPPLTVAVQVWAEGGATFAVPAVPLSGDVGAGLLPGSNRHLIWNAGADWDGQFSAQVRSRVPEHAISLRAAQIREEAQGLADRERVVRLEPEQMFVVGHEMRCFAVQCAEEEGHVVRVGRVMFEVEKGDAHPFTAQRHRRQKVGRSLSRYVAYGQFPGVFEHDVWRAEEHEFPGFPPIDDFCIRARRVARALPCEHDIRVEHRPGTHRCFTISA